MASPPKSRVWIWSAVFALALLFSCVFAAEEAAEEAAASKEEGEPVKPSHVLTLDHSNFEEELAKHPFIVVEFYAPWCGHCKKLEPEYEKAAAELKSHDPPIVLAKVDASEEVNKELSSKYEVQGFPTIKIFKNHGKIIQEYKGPRESDGIVDYLKKQSGPPSVEIKSAEDAKNVIDEKKVFIVGVFSDLSGEEFENFMTVAEKLRSDYDFGHTLDAKLLPKGEATVSRPVIRLLKPFDELFVDSHDFHLDALEKFIAASSLPLVTVFDKDPNNHQIVVKFFKSSNAKAMLFTNFSSELFEEFKVKYNEVAEHYKGKEISFLLGTLDASQGAFQYFGLKEDQAPLIIIQTSDGQKYLKANLQPAQIAPWMKEYMDGNVQPFKKSEPIPEVNDEPVKVVVADSINDIVFNSGKNVLLEFYAPWCGHCQKLAPILDEVAVSFQSDPEVVIAKMDATANDVSKEFEVQGYPTLYFQLPSGKRLLYEGDRTKEDIIDFIQKSKESAAQSNKESAAQSEPVVQSISLKDEL